MKNIVADNQLVNENLKFNTIKSNANVCGQKKIY